jgi:hypothetical protein
MAKLQEVNREVKIIQIDFYFVYLPFYYATSNKGSSGIVMQIINLK